MGPAYTQLLWYKDGEVFPWAREEGRARSAVLYRCRPPLATLCNAACCSNNQSLVMLEVGAEDAGRFRCEAVSAAGRRLGHTTRLRTFPPPVFAHPPIWNTQPEDVRVGAADNILTRGGNEPSRSLKFFNHRQDPTYSSAYLLLQTSRRFVSSSTSPPDGWGVVQVRLGGVAVVVCGVTVGQQYNTVSTQPVHAAWTR